jgi:hypothetical protein
MSDSLPSMLLSAFKMSLSVENDNDAFGKDVDLCTLGQKLKILDAGFSPRNYGEEKLRHLLQKFDSDIELTEDKTVFPPRYFANLKNIPSNFVQTDPIHSSRKIAYDTVKRFAYILPQKYEDLAKLALTEKWYLGSTPKAEYQYELLENYINYTFIRLVHEDKIIICDSGKFATFNTGLVDGRYEQIFALFEPNRNQAQDWFLRSFCIAGEDTDGKLLVSEFSELPLAAEYFAEPRDFIYNLRSGAPIIDWDHIIVENADRMPIAFFENLHIKNFTCRDCSKMDDGMIDGYIASLKKAFDSDKRSYRTAIRIFRGAVEDSLKKVHWNYKTAIPMYYPKDRKVNLLLPLCLVDDEKANVALVVERTNSGKYQAHTILQLEWAYQNARLICRPDSDWLSASLIEAL